MMEKSRPYQEYLNEILADPLEAAGYLNAAMEEGDKELFLLALRNVAEARLGGMSKLAEVSGLNRESLYRMLSGKGNPELKSLDRLLHALGLKISVEVDERVA
jgi:probable addiction module antidote protein